VNIFCLNCYNLYKTRRKKWWDVKCPHCGEKPVYAFAYHKKLTVVEVLLRLFKFHFGDDIYFKNIKDRQADIMKQKGILRMKRSYFLLMMCLMAFFMAWLVVSIH